LVILFLQQAYLKNAYVNSFTEPILIGLDNQGNDIPISANEAMYRFCFVEKTRIDNSKLHQNPLTNFTLS